MLVCVCVCVASAAYTLTHIAHLIHVRTILTTQEFRFPLFVHLRVVHILSLFSAATIHSVVAVWIYRNTHKC